MIEFCFTEEEACEFRSLQAFERYFRNIVDAASGGSPSPAAWVEALRAGLSRLDTDREERRGAMSSSF